jgi:hypothetical protein
MVLFDLRQLTNATLQLCEMVANGHDDRQLLESLHANRFEEYLPTGFGPDVGHWIEAVIRTAAVFRAASQQGEGPMAYKMYLHNLLYSLERLAAAAEAVRP